MIIPFLKMLIERPLWLFLLSTVLLTFIFYPSLPISEQVIFPNSSQQIMDAPLPLKGLPMRLIIPSIDVDTQIEYMGVTKEGAMEVPVQATTAGWFKLGPRPGERGNAVIAGHFDGERGEPGVFMYLNQLKKGDTITVEDESGSSTSFVVRESRIYDPGYADSVFSASDSAHLNLITCDGMWDGVAKSYSKRLVLFADLKP